MEGLFLENEREHKSVSLITSLIIHLALLLLLLINFLKYTPLEPGQKGIVISFGTVEGSEGDPNSEITDEELSETLQEETASSSSEPEKVPEAPAIPEKPKVIAEKSPVVVNPKPQKEQIPAEKTAEEKKAEAEALKKARAEEEARLKAEEEAKRQKELEEKKAKFGNLLSGKNNEETNQGDPDASKLENLSQGSGLVGGGLANREVVFEPNIKENSQKSGTVVIRICVDSDGNVVESDYTQKGSTTSDAALVAVAEKAAKEYKFTLSTISRQCGTVTIKFVVK